MPDKSHAANAKARATQQVAKGNLTSSEKKIIDLKANKILGNKFSVPDDKLSRSKTKENYKRNLDRTAPRFR